MKIRLENCFEEIVSVKNLLLAWKEFIKGKRNKPDVNWFYLNLINNIITLHFALVNQSYKHGGYFAFNVCDPKPRHIHKANVRDRLVHHAVYRILYQFFDRTFISESFSCRNGKGTHKAIEKFRRYFYKASQNHTITCYVLKMDIQKFFASINHKVLLEILRGHIADDELIWLLENIISSFNSKGKGVSLPLGNLTSQLFVNIYMNKFDQFIKHKLKIKYYIRFADDFVILDPNSQKLRELVAPIKSYLKQNLQLDVHPDKIYIKTVASGIDFLGFVNFPDHRVLRAKTKRRMLKRINQKNLPSYLGLIKHCHGYKLSQIIADLLKI